MMGIGYLLAEGEMQKEALSQRAANLLALAGIGVAGYASYDAHRHGQRQAMRDFRAGTPGERRPDANHLFTPGNMFQPIKRWGYDSRLLALQHAQQQ